jgi:hypothetical protein
MEIQPTPVCSKCKANPVRGKGQRYCKACHLDWYHRKKRGETKELVPVVCDYCGATGIRNLCKFCFDSYTRDKYHRRYADTEANQDRRRKRSERSLAHYYDVVRNDSEAMQKRQARQKARDELRAGRIKRQPCSICGEPGQMHHPDYNQPTLVVWLCPVHHAKEHGK